AIRYVTHNGCVWRALPADFPPWRTVYGFYQRWKASSATLAVHDALRGQARQAVGRKTEPTAAVIDSSTRSCGFRRWGGGIPPGCALPGNGLNHRDYLLQAGIGGQSRSLQEPPEQRHFHHLPKLTWSSYMVIRNSPGHSLSRVASCSMTWSSRSILVSAVRRWRDRLGPGAGAGPRRCSRWASSV
ncbi:MAG: transposase, partial [Actinobacteria bacterium]|nr:transposase [Actinomycetota bacterium]